VSIGYNSVQQFLENLQRLLRKKFRKIGHFPKNLKKCAQSGHLRLYRDEYAVMAATFSASHRGLPSSSFHLFSALITQILYWWDYQLHIVEILGVYLDSKYVFTNIPLKFT
jgi:hypothetical protein